MISPTKIGIALLTLGSSGIATYVGVNYFATENNKIVNKGKSIANLIYEKFDYVLLDFDKDDAIWNQKWGSYKTDNADKDSDVLGIENWSKTTQSTSTKELRNKCKELSSSIVYDNNYENITKYCGREATAEDEALRNNLQIIKGDAGNKWGEKIAKKDRLSTHLTKLGITDTDLTDEKIKPKCEEVKTKKRKEDGYSAFYEAYKLVCTNHKVE